MIEAMIVIHPMCLLTAIHTHLLSAYYIQRTQISCKIFHTEADLSYRKFLDMATENLFFGVFSSVVGGSPEILHMVSGLSLHISAGRDLSSCWKISFMKGIVCWGRREPLDLRWQQQGAGSSLGMWICRWKWCRSTQHSGFTHLTWWCLEKLFMGISTCKSGPKRHQGN